MALSPTLTAPVGARASVEARRPMLVLGARSVQPAAWWLDPLRAILLIVLPIFCFAAYLNRYNYIDFGASEDFVTPSTFALGLYSMALLLLGIIAGRLAMRRQDMVSIVDPERANAILTRLGWITILAYMLLLGTLLVHAGLVLDLVRGDPSAGAELRKVLGRIPGVTSFIQFDVVYLALLSSLVALAGFHVRPRLWIMTAAILMLTFLRAVLASERLALLEAFAAMLVIPVAYRWRPSLWRSLAPFIGISFVFATFAAGEYFRSWQFYRNYYDSYFDFITQRFAGYFSTSINNGSGAYTIYGRIHPFPEITSGWVTRFPGLLALFSHDDLSTLDKFLATYANPEFNNPGGFYSSFIDYPFVIASFFMLGIGIVIGLVHRSFQNKSMVGLVLYPVVFLGLTDLIRVLYIVDVRTLPIFIGVYVALYALHPRQLPRAQFLTLFRAGAAW